MAAIDITRMSAQERLDLLDRLWDSLAAEPDAVPVTPEQRAELDRRLDDMERQPAAGLAWDDVLAAIRSPRQ